MSMLSEAHSLFSEARSEHAARCASVAAQQHLGWMLDTIVASLDTSCGETCKAWDELSQSTPPDVALESMCSLFRHAALRAQRAPPSVAREVIAKPKPAQAEILTRARATKAECSKLHRGLNQLRRDVTRDLGRLHHELTSAAAPGGGGGGGGGDGGSGGGGPTHSFTPIGHIESCFLQKNGTPRQAGLAGSALARLRVRCGTNPSHALEGLEHFSHVWLLWVFDRNGGEVSMLQPCAAEAAALGTRGCTTALCTPLSASRWASRPSTASATRRSRPRCTLRGSAARRRGSSRAARRTAPARSASRSSNCAACATTPTLRRCCNPTRPGCNPTRPATLRAQACAATSCCSAGLTWSTARQCSTSSRALQPLTNWAAAWSTRGVAASSAQGCSASSRACLGPTHLYASTCTCCVHAVRIWNVLRVQTQVRANGRYADRCRARTAVARGGRRGRATAPSSDDHCRGEQQ